MDTKERYHWKFDEIPGSYLSTKYYDEMEHVELTGGAVPRNTALLNFPPIDMRSIITRWGISICIDPGGMGLYEEQIFGVMDAVSITLRINRSAVPGYSGKDFPPNSWIHYNALAANNWVMMVMNPVFLIPIQFPIFENTTPLQIEVVDTALPSGTYFLFGRIMGRYID